VTTVQQNSTLEPAAPSTRPWPLLAVAVTLVLWASAFVAIRHLSSTYHPASMALGRMLVGSVCLSAVVWWRARGRRSERGGRLPLPQPGAADWLRIVVIGVLWYAVYMLALNTGERRVDAGTSAMLVQLSPILIAVLAAIFLGERFSRWLGAGLALAFAGVVVIALGSSGGSSRDLGGVALCLVSALAYAVALVLQKPLAGRFTALHLTWLACSIGAIVMLPWIGQLARDVHDAPASATLWVLYLGVFPTAIAFTTYGFALQHIPASRLGVSTYLVPVLTILLAWALLSETPPALAYVGGVLALGGVWVARRG
jgi:drug/metabolite transporter (DMT)-like permease